jgi:pimeloyl-ACP methyl ester carboxylesterase
MLTIGVIWQSLSVDDNKLPEIAASRIGYVANDLTRVLQENLGLVNSDNLYFYGHSLGSLLLTKVAENYGSIAGFVSLDPAAGAEVYDLNSDGIDDLSLDDELPDIKSIAANSIALVAADKLSGIAGDNKHAATAERSFIVDFINYDNSSDILATIADFHSAVVTTFIDMLSDGLEVNVLASDSYLRDNQWNDKGEKKSGWFSFGSYNHEGVIKVSLANGIENPFVDGLYFVNNQGQLIKRIIEGDSTFLV